MSTREERSSAVVAGDSAALSSPTGVAVAEGTRSERSAVPRGPHASREDNGPTADPAPSSWLSALEQQDAPRTALDGGTQRRGRDSTSNSCCIVAPVTDLTTGCSFIEELCFLPACDPREYIIVEKPLTWTEAQNYCRENYNDLATIENSEEHNEVIEVSRKYYTRHVWIGLRHYPSKWKWSMENEFKDGTDFRNWANTEPSDSTEGRENCVVTNNGLWFGTTCGSAFGFFCFTGSSASPSFKFISTPMNWTSAMEYCRKHHVDLAVVRNLPENNQLKEMVKDEYNWIGLYRDPWKWSDGKLLSYTKWNIGEPNQGVNGPCVFLHKGHWGDYECESAIYFVCNKVSVWQNVVRVKVTPKTFTENLHESAEDILLQWNQRVKELYPRQVIKLTWKKQPDGKIFHSEKKEKKENLNTCVINT
ncbi:macrophage mannose receptor 1-like [Gouania willdenowi]|uniref:macrophage mannose receptor 1-like n=1 Tax=Gouania willdenowi TaxID=441366 RepID=UPI00105598EC|nr:macrophage mannose receptor 1-like [Gouania willdenowi]